MKKKVLSVLLVLVLVLTLGLVTAVPVAAQENIPISITGDVEATITRTDTLDEVTFDIEIQSENVPHGVYGVGLVFATSDVSPDFQVWYAEAEINAPNNTCGWYYQDWTGDPGSWNGWGGDVVPLSEKDGFSVVAREPTDKMFSISVPTSELGGFGATYYYAIQVRTNQLNFYPEGWGWGSPVSEYASVKLLVLNEDTGKLYGTIQLAIDAPETDTGDTITVAAGTYTEAVTVNKSLTLEGEDRGTTEIKFGYGSYSTPSPLTISADGVTVSGFTIRSGPYIEPAWTIVVEGDSALLTDLYVIKEPLLTYNDQPRIGGSAFWLAPGLDGFNFTHSIVDSAWNGIYAPRNPGSSNIVVRDIDFTYPGEYAILLMMVTGATIEENTFTCTGHSIADKDSNGIVITRGSNAIEIRGGNQFIGSQPVLARNHIGILLQAYADGTMGSVGILSNEISGFNTGILVEDVDTSGISIHGNNITGNATYGVRYLGSDTVNATNNWWGDATGADHADNPHGTGQGGDTVSNNVDFIPWYATDTTTPGTENVTVRVGETEEVRAYSDTIQGGIDAALPGDTITVAVGTYKEHITIDKSNLRLMGEDKQTTIIDATQDSSWPVAKPGILIGEYPFVDGVQDVTVSGFTIRDAAIDEKGENFQGAKYGVGPQALAGILIYNSSSNTIENNILINNYWQIFLCAEWPAAGYTECMNNRIANNVIQNSENDGVYLYSDGGVFLEGTEIIGNEIDNADGDAASGVEFWGWPEGGDTPTITNTVVKGNLITGCTYGVRIRDDVSDITGTSVNYNNFVDNTNYGIYNGVASTIDAAYNWWGSPTGPGRKLPHGKWVGKGDKVSDNVDYIPWLHKSKKDVVPSKKPSYAQAVVLDNTGDYGWNTFSAPIFLDDEADTWKKLRELADLAYSVAYRFDSDNQTFVPLKDDDEYAINPGEGFFIKMRDVGSLTILYSTEKKLIPPTRPLTAGWNLIGLANLEDMNVDDAFASIASAPGLAGYSQVISPTGNAKSGPVLADGTIYVGESYWVYMLGARTLAGFTMTPVEWVP